jgi:hypothetical protein
MASGVPFTRTAAFVLLLAVTAASAMPPAPAPQVFVVGGEARGWRKPETTDETYNHWAARNRFRVGDFLCKKASNQSHSSHRHRISVDPLLLVHMQPNELNAADFKYDKANDSVLLVSRDDYKLCAAAKPTQRFEGGDTRFRLDHSGLFYFLSGAAGHCDAGQRMAVRVMAPQPPAAMSPGDGEFTGGSKPAPAGGASVSISKPPPPSSAGSGSEHAKSSGGAASVRAQSLFAGYYYHVFVLAGAVLLLRC